MYICIYIYILNNLFHPVIVLFILAVVGTELFSESYIKVYGDNANNTEINQMPRMPRWNFVDVSHSFMIVFRVLCGEWIESMWDCLNAHGWACVPFFLGVKIIGGFVVNFEFYILTLILIVINQRFSITLK